MPIYEYICEKCENILEELVPITVVGTPEEPEVVCLKCGSNMCRKQVTSCSFQLKGTGWYVTDYKGKK